MKVAVLTVGRSGSMSLFQACRKARNFSAGHDSKEGALAAERVQIPDGHIEIDTRFAWMLGPLNECNGNKVHYAFLTRDIEAVATSYNHRWENRKGIMRAYCEGVLQRNKPAQNLSVARDLVATAEANIRTFLYNRPHSVIRMESWSEDLEAFFADIGAEVDLEAARAAFAGRHNETRRTALFFRARYRLSRCFDALEELLKGLRSN